MNKIEYEHSGLCLNSGADRDNFPDGAQLNELVMILKHKAGLPALQICCLTVLCCCASVSAEDWPMWRRDAGRTAVTAEPLPDSLTVQWVRSLPPLSPAFHSERLQFDAGYEPVVADGMLLMASSRTNSVTAYDAATGREEWSFHTNGPVRFAPAVWKTSVCFGSDDGYLYCVDLKSGKLRWKYRAVPSNRRLLGNRRLISVWPVRGGPVVADGAVYFAAGVWPFEGVFVYSLEVDSGSLNWRNERLGYMFGQQPHNTQAIGGLAPQGYLVVDGDELVVPCSTAYPARLNLATGSLIDFSLPAPGRLPGGWFAALDSDTARAVRRGRLTFDEAVNSQLHEDKVNKGRGVAGISRQIEVGGKTLKFDDKIKGVEGTVHSVIAANGQLFVSTREGRIYAFGSRQQSNTSANNWSETTKGIVSSRLARNEAKAILKQAPSSHGYAVVAGLDDGELVKALLLESQFHVIAVDDNSERTANLRHELVSAGIYGTRASVIEADPRNISLPPYIAAIITTETPGRMTGNWLKLLQAVRPFGGIAALRAGTDKSLLTNEQLQALQPANFRLITVDGSTAVHRVGALPGAAEYSGNYALCEDQLVRFPLGVVWFDDTIAHFKRSPQPLFANGVMISRPKDWHAPRVKGDYSIDYPLLPPVLSDIYTGRVFDSSEQADLRARLPKTDPSKPEQSYYHAPHQKTALNPDPPVVGERTNPLTGKREPRVFPKTYGCDGGVDYGLFYTLRAGTAAFYDKSIESGTVFLSGPRSGCTNSVIPSGGLLNVPYFYEGCTCSYPLPTAVSLVAMPENHEQWSSWGEQQIEPGSIQHIGINFGAPGDRMSRSGTLWLDYPSVGGPSPTVRIDTTPKAPAFRYRHSLWMNDGDDHPWIAASAAEGLSRFVLSDLQPGRYTVRLYFAELAGAEPGDRIQTVSLQGRPVLSHFDIREQAGALMKCHVQTVRDVHIDGKLTVELTAEKGTTLVSGIEVVPNHERQ